MYKDGDGPVSARLRELSAANWQSATSHPMVKEIAAGTLPHQNFRRYFEQNTCYLEDYARAIGVVLSKAPDPAALEMLGQALGRIIDEELPANRRFLERLGGDPGQLRGPTTMSATTYAYTRHLLTTVSLGDCAAGITALLPCQWTYGDIGAQIAGAKPDDPIYADWVALFGAPEYAEVVNGTRGLLDRLASPDDESFGRLQVIFDTSTRYEVDFWEMAYGPSPHGRNTVRPSGY